MNIIKTILRAPFDRNYYLSKAMWKRGQRKRLNACNGVPVINYQMGKVGSSTVQASLEKHLPGCPVYHVHHMNPRRVKSLERDRRRYFGTERIGYLRRPGLSEFLLEEIRRGNRRWKLVTLVREPVARNVSTFFENLQVTRVDGAGVFRVLSDYYGFEACVALDDLGVLIEYFHERLVHERPLVYFDDELKAVFGLDVYDEPFPRGQGFQIIHGETADLLVIRLEELDQCAPNAFDSFLDIKDFSLCQTNLGDAKDYAPLYRAFKEQIRLNPAYLDKMYDSRFALHFYSPEELHHFRRKWTCETITSD
ncbi:MAG: putative capsular polysaccharide synthesis family protein [bacterium]